MLHNDYLHLLKKCLTGVVIEDPAIWRKGRSQSAEEQTFVGKQREHGADIPATAFSMIGTRRMNHLQECVETALREGIPGDLLEAGVWRGGASILMRAVLAVHGVADRRAWVADSFQGMPAVDLERYPLDAEWASWPGTLVVSLEQVRANFQRFGMLDAQVRFLPGWFNETLAVAPVEKLAVLRMDGDLYASTVDILAALYPRVSPGGFVIVDDYYFESCRSAVHEYRSAHGITAPIQDIDGIGAFWRVP